MAKKKPFLLSDSSVNSYGFRLDMSKLDLTRFSANPVMLYNHRELVGKWENLEVVDDKLYGTPVFMELDSEPEAAKVALRVETGFVSGASLGINPTKVTYFENEPPLVEAEVLECSVCDIPSNKNAIRVLGLDGTELTLDQVQTTLSALAETKIPQNPKIQIEMKLNAQAMTALGIQEGADEAAISAAIISLKAKADKAEQLEAEQKTAKEARIEKMLSTGIAEGRFTAAEKSEYKELADANIDLCEKTIAKLPIRTTLNSLGNQGGKNLSEIPEERKAWTRLEWAKNDTLGLLDIKANNPELYAEISKR